MARTLVNEVSNLPNVIQKLELISGTVATLPLGSSIKIGGVRKELTSALTVDSSVSGLGGMESPVAANTFYYVYAVLDVGSVFLIATTSEIKPSAYLAYKKVGAIQTDGNSNMMIATPYNHGLETGFVSYSPFVPWGNMTGAGRWKRTADGKIFIYNYFDFTGNASGGTLVTEMPGNILADIGKHYSTNVRGEVGVTKLYNSGSGQRTGITILQNSASFQALYDSNATYDAYVSASAPYTSTSGDSILLQAEIFAVGFPDTIDWNDY